MLCVKHQLRWLARPIKSFLNLYPREGKRAPVFYSPLAVVSSWPLIKTNTQIKKWAKSHFTEKEIKMVGKSVQKTLVIKEVQIKTIVSATTYSLEWLR